MAGAAEFGQGSAAADNAARFGGVEPATLAVFVSAVSNEFQPYREHLRRLLDTHRIAVKIQESFSAGADDVILKLDDYVRASAAVIHLIGLRTGAVAGPRQTAAILARHPNLRSFPPVAAALSAPDPAISFTQWEAYLALYHDKALFLCAPDAPVEPHKPVEADDPSAGDAATQAARQTQHAERLRAFERFEEVRFTSADSLAAELVTTPTWQELLVERARADAFRPDLSRLPPSYLEGGPLFGRDAESATLREAWRADDTRIAALDALGGQGKTALASAFARDLLRATPRRGVALREGCEAAFAWSFYSQGSDEDRQTSADEFFKAAFTFFADAEPPREPREKGVALAKLVQARRTLLILDGLEPLQVVAGRTGGGEAAAGVTGRLKDPGVDALLKLLADHNPGLCIVTTRVPLIDLKDHPAVLKLALERLATADGVALLRARGVAPEHDGQPLPASVARDLERLVEDLDGHALALTAIGLHLALVEGGDIRKLEALPSLAELGAQGEGRHRNPFRVFRAIEKSLLREIRDVGAEQDPIRCAAGKQLALLFFLGFHDRPADQTLLPAVFSADAPEPDPRDVQLAATDLGDGDPKTAPAEKRAREAVRAAAWWWPFRIGRAARAEPPTEAPTPPALTDAEREAVREARRRVILRKLFRSFGDIRDTQRAHALGRLADLGLLDRPAKGVAWSRAALDGHPLVREYFGERLRGLDAEAYKAAHGRLYDHLRFVGLPPEFQEPVAYAALALKAAFERDHYGAFKSGLLAKSLSPGWLQSVPKALRALSADALQAAFALVDGPAYEAGKRAFLPTDEAGMAPLFAGIGHGCAAEREEECFAEVYSPRIARGNEDYATKKLGLIGAELAALASFFETPFATPSPRLTPSRRALVSGNAAFKLRALSRLEDAVAPFRAALEASAALGDAANAALAAGNLSDLLLLLGRLDGRTDPEGGAVAAALAARDHAGKVTGARALFLHMVAEAWVAAAAQALGRRAEAEAAYRAAERLQAERQPTLPRLYSAAGFLAAEALLARGRADEVLARATWSLPLMERAEDLLSIGLDHLTLARTALAEARPPAEARAAAEAALTALRKANQEWFLPPALLAAAEARSIAGDEASSEDALREAEDIAVRGPMPLHLANLALLRGRFALAAGHAEDAAAQRDRAQDLIDAQHYGFARAELALLSAEINPTPATLDAAAREILGDVAIPQTAEHGFGDGAFGLLPRFERLAPDHKDLPTLKTRSTAYNAARDAWLEDTGGIPEPGE